MRTDLGQGISIFAFTNDEIPSSGLLSLRIIWNTFYMFLLNESVVGFFSSQSGGKPKRVVTWLARVFPRLAQGACFPTFAVFSLDSDYWLIVLFAFAVIGQVYLI